MKMPAHATSSLIFAVLAGLLQAASTGQSKDSSRVPAAEPDATKAQVTSLRDEFVKAVDAAGFKCSITPPVILVEDVPSFGKYEPASNTLTTAAWSQLTSEEKGLFLRSHPTESEARQEFEIGVHHWVLVHELGHWWQACNGYFDNPDHFAVELGANRIAAAYWRKYDPSLVAHQRAVFDGLVRRWQNPIPNGQDEKACFNANYEKLGPTPGYIWFQARMCLAAIDETPSPEFADVLRQNAR